MLADAARKKGATFLTSGASTHQGRDVWQTYVSIPFRTVRRPAGMRVVQAPATGRTHAGAATAPGAYTVLAARS